MQASMVCGPARVVVRPPLPAAPQPCCSHALRRRHAVARVAAVQPPPSASFGGEQEEPRQSLRASSVEPQASAQQQPQREEEQEDLELVQLDSEQEQLLSWMLNQSADAQEEDLDEMLDYDEFLDDEFSELREEVEQLLSLPTQVELLRVGDKVLGTVFEVGDDGAYVDVGGKAAGFVPTSECSFAKLKTPLEALRVGMQREFLVVQPEDENGQVVLSLGAIEAGVFWQRIRQLHEEEAIVTVRVESVNRGGLLVHYGPYDGFVPNSQFGPSIVPERVEELVGQNIPVKFLEVDEAKERLVFSNKRASTAVQGMDVYNIKVGDVMEGVVQSVKPYGAFVDVGAGLTGLLHVSQLSHDRVVSMERMLNPGDKLKVMVLSLDPDRARLVLSTKKLEPQPGDMLRDPKAVYDKAEAMGALFREGLDATRRMAEAPDGTAWEQQQQQGLPPAAPQA